MKLKKKEKHDPVYVTLPKNPHTDPIMYAWGSLEILLGIHRSNKHTKGSPKSYKKKIWLHLKDFHIWP